MNKDMNIEIIQAVQEVINNSYSPYSKFKVGCAIMLENGEIITGTNVENASIGATICAERSAMVSLISQGYNTDEIKAIAISSKTDDFISPCGICRQFIGEFVNRNIPMFLVNQNSDFLETNMETLLPNPFQKEDLENV